MTHADNSIITGKFRGSLGENLVLATGRAKQSLQNRRSHAVTEAEQ